MMMIMIIRMDNLQFGDPERYRSQLTLTRSINSIMDRLDLFY